MADKQLRVNFSVNEADLVRFTNQLLKAGVAAKDVENILEDIKKSSTSTPPFDPASKGIDSLVTGVKAFLALGVVNYLKDAAVEASKLAAAGEGIRGSFANLGLGINELKALRSAVGGAVSDLNLMKIAVKAVQKGMSQQELGKVLEFVDKQSKHTGKSLQDLANVMIDSIGKQSTKGLKDTGLSMKFIEDRGKAIGFMPALLEDMARVSADLGEVTDSTAQSYDQLATSQANLQEAFGKLVNSGPFNQLRNFIANELTKLTDFINDPGGLKGLTSDELVSAYEKSLAKTAQLEKDYLVTRGAFNLKALREQLEDEKELRFEIGLQGQTLEAQAKKAAQAEVSAKKKADGELQAEREADEIKKAEKDAEAYSKAYAKTMLEQQKFLRKFLRENAEDPDEPDIESFGLDKMVAEQDPLALLRPYLDAADKQISEREVAKDNFKAAEESVEEITFGIEDALAATFQIAAIFNSLGEEGGGANAFLKKFLALAGGLVSLIPGGQIPGLVLGGISGFFNEGGKVGAPAGPDRDSILAGLTLGEYVVNRKSTGRSALLLDAINAGELDDKIFMKLQQSPVIVNVDQDQVVKAIQSMPQVDFYKNGSVLYEVRQSAASNRVERKRRLMM